MREQIEAYVNGLFADAALTIRNAEVLQEILQHALDRYDDLLAAGKPEQAAYDEAVSGIGDVSELYEHKPAEGTKTPQAFPAPPDRPDPTPAAPAKKKKLPGWAIALICAGAALFVLAALSLAVLGLLKPTVGGYTYDHAGSYETLARTGFGSGEQTDPAAAGLDGIDEIEIHWLSGSVYLAESDTDRILLQEDYTGDNDDYRMRYAVQDGRLVIQPCRSRASTIGLPEKTLTVFLPKTLTLDEVTVETVSADVELLGGQTGELCVTTTSGGILGPGIRAESYTFGTVSGGVRLSSLPADGSSIECESVSGDMSLSCAACPKDVELDSVSGSLTLTLPAGSQYSLVFDSVSGQAITTGFTPGSGASCSISAETVSGDLELRAP